MRPLRRRPSRLQRDQPQSRSVVPRRCRRPESQPTATGGDSAQAVQLCHADPSDGPPSNHLGVWATSNFGRPHDDRRLKAAPSRPAAAGSACGAPPQAAGLRSPRRIERSCGSDRSTRHQGYRPAAKSERGPSFRTDLSGTTMSRVYVLEALAFTVAGIEQGPDLVLLGDRIWFIPDGVYDLQCVARPRRGPRRATIAAPHRASVRLHTAVDRSTVTRVPARVATAGRTARASTDGDDRRDRRPRPVRAGRARRRGDPDPQRDPTTIPKWPTDQRRR
jgi:hypothetical protein